MFFRLQVRNPADTNFPVSRTLHQLLNQKVPHSNFCCHFPFQTSVLSGKFISFFFLFFTAQVVRRWPLQGWSVMCVFPSLKCFAHYLTLLVPTQVSPYTHWHCVWISDVAISSLARNSTIIHINTSLQAILALRHDYMTGSHDVIFLLARDCG